MHVSVCVTACRYHCLVYLGTVTHLLSYYKFCVNVCECMLMKDCIICVSCVFLTCGCVYVCCE